MHKIELAIEPWEKICARNKNFLDTSSKLSEYRDLQNNDNMKEYLTSSTEFFMDLCKKVALNSMGFAAQNVDATKYGCRIVATEAKNDNWMNMRQQLYCIHFFREPDPLEDTVIRQIADEVKKQNYTKAFVCTSSGFSRAASNFAESRPIELVNKQKLEMLLEKAGI